MTKSNTSISKFNDFIMLSFFPVVMIYMLLQFSGYRFEILGIFVRLALIYSALTSLKYVGKCVVIPFLLAYIFYNLISVVFVGNSQIGMSGYLYDVLNFLLPMSAFFIGCNYKLIDYKYYNWFLYSVLFCFGLGLIFYFFSTTWYVERVSNISYSLLGTELTDLDQLHSSTRFSSFMYGPYPIQYLGIPALSILLYYFVMDKSRNVTKRIYYIFSFITIILSIILCQQRMAWGYMALLIAYYFLFAPGGRKNTFGLLIVGGALFVVFDFVLSSGNGIVESVLQSRMDEMKFSTALSGRANQYDVIWNNWNRPLLGHGMGSGGAIARVAGLPGVSDAGYMKILYENGILGSFIFFGIIILTLIRVLKNYKMYYIELHIVLFFLIAMIGSNSLCISLYYSVIFWYAIGRVWNRNNINLQLANK